MIISNKMRIFVPMNTETGQAAVTCDNMIIADADFIDKVAFDLIVNFERMIGRRIPKADMARWIDCVALDGGVREGKEQTQVVLIHNKKSTGMANFTPGDYEKELDAKAFSDNLGEFVLSAVSEEDIASKEELFVSTVELCCGTREVKRLILIPDEQYYDQVRHALRRADDEKRITLLAMQPMPGGNYRQEILGYSLMSALGIRSEELTGQ